MSRRRFLGTSLKVAAAIAAVPLVAESVSASPSNNGYFRTTAALKLRSGPGTTYSVILVMPLGSPVTGVGPQQNGFSKVAYRGTVGWAATRVLEVSNGGSSDTPQSLGSGWTTANVNMRSAPEQGPNVMKVLQVHTQITLYNSFYGNYQLISHQGQYGWVYLDYLTTSQGPAPTYLTTTDRLNLRAQPNSSAKVLAIIPSGASVRSGDQRSNGYISITWNGISGWGYADYLV